MRSQDSWCCFLLPALPFWTTWASRYAVYPYAMYHGVTATCLSAPGGLKNQVKTYRCTARVARLFNRPACQMWHYASRPIPTASPLLRHHATFSTAVFSVRVSWETDPREREKEAWVVSGKSTAEVVSSFAAPAPTAIGSSILATAPEVPTEPPSFSLGPSFSSLGMGSSSLVPLSSLALVVRADLCTSILVSTQASYSSQGQRQTHRASCKCSQARIP